MAKQTKALKRLIGKLGGPTQVAALLEITHSAVCQWRRIPAEHCPLLEAWSVRRGKPVPCEVMRPDIFKRLPVIQANTPPIK